MDNTEREKLEKELELINKLEKIKKGGLVVFKRINSPEYNPDKYYLGRQDKEGLTKEELDEKSKYYTGGIICITETLVTRENVHLYKNRSL